MTARLTLICHAPTAAARAARFPSDERLDGAGEAALARAAPSLAAAVAEARRCVSGPERRALGTAAELGPAFTVDAALRDQDVGRWAGRGLAELAGAEPEALAAWRTNPAAAPHGGESLNAILARVDAWMGGQAAVGGHVAAVTHPAVVRAAVASALRAGPPGFWRVEAPPLAMAVLSHDGRRWALAALVPPP